MKRWHVYTAIILVPLLGGSAASLLRVIVAFALRDLGTSIFEITLLSSAFMLSRALFSPVVGNIADRGIKRYIIIAAGFLGLLVDSQLYLHVPYAGVLILRTLDGIFGAMVWPTMQAVVHFSSPQKMRARVMSMYFVMGSIGMSSGYLLYSYATGNVEYAMILIATIYLVEFGLGFVFRGVEVKKEKKKISKSVRKPGMMLLALTFLFGMYMSLGNEVLLFYLAEVLNMGRVNATMVLFVAGMLALVGSIILGHIADKRSFHLALLLLGLLAPLSAIMIAINMVPLAVAGTIAFFIAGRGYMPISRSFTASTSTNIGTSLGFINLASNLGSMIAPLIGGYIMDSTEHSTFLGLNLSAMIFVVVGTAILIVTLAMSRQRARGDVGS